MGERRRPHSVGAAGTGESNVKQGTTTIEPRIEVNNWSADVFEASELLGYGLPLAGQSCGPLSWLDFPLQQSWAQGAAKSRWSVSKKASKDHLDLLRYYYNVVRSLNLEGGILIDRSYFGVGTFHLSENGGSATPEGKAPRR